MSPFAAQATGPQGTRFEGVRIRILGLELKAQPGVVKLVIQAMQGKTPIAESPLHVEWMPEADFKAFIAASSDWKFTMQVPKARNPKFGREYQREQRRKHRARVKAEKLAQAS